MQMPRRIRLASVAAAAILIVGAPVAVVRAIQAPAAAAPPVADRRPVTDEYHGMRVVDEYRWLEDWNDPAVKVWSDGENAFARSVLDALPERDAIRARMRQLIAGARSFSQVKYSGGRLFALESQPPKQQPFLVQLTNADEPSSARVIFDPAADPKSGAAIDWYVPSPGGDLVAVSVSLGGSERGDLHVYDTATGREVETPIARVNNGTAGGSLCWNADGKGFFYTRYPGPGERPEADLDFYMRVYVHALGAPAAEDRYELGKDFPRIAEIQLACSPDGRYVAANVQNGDGGGFAQYLRRPDGTWTALTRFTDKVDAVFFGADGGAYLVSHAGAPHGKILRLRLDPARTPRMADAMTIVPESRDAVVDFDFYAARGVVATASRLYVIDLVGGPNRVRVFESSGRPAGVLPLPSVAAVNELVAIGGDTVLFKATTFVEPSAWYEIDGSKPISSANAVQPTRRGISTRSTIDLSAMQVARETAISKDGTRVPMTIVHRKGLALDGSNPTLLTGYGGYGLSTRPFFLGTTAIWLEQGGVFADANLRGGGEFGEAWHDAGRLIHKQNVFDDFIACAERLVKAGYTSPAHLAIQGGSNGGLLMGAVMTERPDLFKAVVSHVGIYDMLRVELSPNGSFNVPEFGTVKDGDQFRAMRAYSPYHRVRDGVAYPPTLFLTGANDPRVDPMHSRKMTARLQAAMKGTGTVLLRTSAQSGHGLGTSLDEAIEQSVDVYAFLFANLGVRYRPVPKDLR